MKLLHHLKSSSASVLSAVRKKLTRRKRTKSTRDFNRTGITAQDLWFMTHKVVEPKALRLGEARARKRYLDKLEANRKNTHAPRPISRQVRRALERQQLKAA